MRLNAVKILKISVTNDSKKEILEEIQKDLFQNAKKSSGASKIVKIFTPNAEQIVLARENPEFRDVLNRADISRPDSVGVVWASRVLTQNPIPSTIPGVEFMENLAALAAGRHVSIGLIGGLGNIAIGALECLQEKYQGLRGWDSESTDVVRIAERIKEHASQFVFVGLGAPKQEFFIQSLARQLQETHYKAPVVLMAVGGSFDIIAGRLPRAPRLLRSLGLEWLWRLVLEPRRIVRQLSLVTFVWVVLREKLSLKSKI